MVFSFQFSVFSFQLSVVSCQFSVVSFQLSVVSCQLSVVSVQWAVFSGQWAVGSGQVLGESDLRKKLLGRGSLLIRTVARWQRLVLVAGLGNFRSIC
jgi:hypothetical protein